MSNEHNEAWCVWSYLWQMIGIIWDDIPQWDDEYIPTSLFQFFPTHPTRVALFLGRCRHFRGLADAVNAWLLHD